jgi:hypothetical protein
VCYLVTALLFSLLILDLAAFVITVAPSKGIFKYTDLVYTGALRKEREGCLSATVCAKFSDGHTIFCMAKVTVLCGAAHVLVTLAVACLHLLASCNDTLTHANSSLNSTPQ